MKTSSFGYLVKEGTRSLWVNRLMSTAAIGVLAACMILVGAAGLFAANVSNIVSYFEDENEIVVFLQDGIDQKGVDDANLKIRMMSNVSEANFVSNEEALQEQMEKYGEYAWLLEEYQGEENMLPHAFRVKVKELEKLEQTAQDLLDMEEVQEVRVPTEVAHTLLGIRSVGAAPPLWRSCWWCPC